MQLKETRRTATTAGPPPAAAAERGKGRAETGTDAAGTAAGTVRTADTGAGEYLFLKTKQNCTRTKRRVKTYVSSYILH